MSGVPFPVIEAVFWLSLFAAPLGAFLIFRRLSFFGDALGHASLAGIAFVLLLGWHHPLAMSVGAVGSVLVTSFLLNFFERRVKLPSDVALTLSYSGVFAMGLLMMSKHEHEHELEHILFGNIWEISSDMIWFLRAWALIVVSAIIMGWRALWASVIDPVFAKTVGYSSSVVDIAFLVLTSVSVIGMIQSVGVVLVAAYLVLPPAAVAPWVRSLRNFVMASSVAAFISGIFGLCLAQLVQWPAGPSIAFSAFVIVLLSHLTQWIRVMLRQRSGQFN